MTYDCVEVGVGALWWCRVAEQGKLGGGEKQEHQQTILIVWDL